MRDGGPPRECRVPFVRPLQLTLLESDKPPERLRALNLSRGGMFVEAVELLPEGTRVSLALEACGRVLPFAEGEVVWRTQDGFGLRFTQLGPRAQALVEHLIERGGTAAAAPPAATVRRGARRWQIAAAIAAAAAVAALAGQRSRPAHQVVAPAATAAVAAPPALTPVAPPAATPAPPPPMPSSPAEFAVAIPSGAVSSLRVTLTSRGIAVEPTFRRRGVLRRIFKLPRPLRVVIDVAGGEPQRSWRATGNAIVETVRVGARDHGTRVVVDLPPSLAGLRVQVRVPKPRVAVASHFTRSSIATSSRY